MQGDQQYGISPERLMDYAREVKAAVDEKIQIAIVIGGGNIFRGLQGMTGGTDRVQGDYMGMLATVINSLAIQDTLEKNGIKACVLSAVGVPKIAELYVEQKAIESLKKGYVVILSGGTGNPYFTTDTTAALRAAELKADVLLKATQVDGVYDCDPKVNKNAKRYKSLSYDEAINKNLRIMDTSAFSLCKDNNLPIIVFNFHHSGNLFKVLSGKNIGTLVSK